MYNQKVKFNYNVSKFVDCEYPAASSCVKHQVTELTDIHAKYGGFPTTYTLGNTTIHQRWWDKNELDFAEIGSLLNMQVVTISSIKQPPGQVVPWHRDTFFLLKKEFPDKATNSSFGYPRYGLVYMNNNMSQSQKYFDILNKLLS